MLLIVFLHRVLLRFYPPQYRARFGAEILATARALARDPRRRRWRAALDALITVRDVRRDARGTHARAERLSMEQVLHDVRLALRGLRKDMRFTAFVVAILAVAIGANATLLGLADRLIFRGPEHVRDSSQVMRVYLHAEPPGRAPVTRPEMGHVLFAAIRDTATTVAQTASYATQEATLGRGAGARVIQVGYVSPEFFELLGVAPLAGRLLDRRDDQGQEGGAVVLSFAMWQREFGGDASALGRTLDINGATLTVVGITPRGFTGADIVPLDAWTSIGPVNRRTTDNWETSWNAQWLKTIVRIPATQSAESVEADITAVFRASYTGASPVMRAARLRVAPLTASDTGAVTTDVRILKWLSVITALIFVIACANVMSLLLARGEARRREIGMCMALGASRARIVRQLLLEAGLLAGAGALAGLGLAAGLGGAARALLFESVAWTQPPVNVGVLVWSAVIAVVATVLTGLVPAMGASSVSLTRALRGPLRAGARSGHRLRSVLTMVQAAVSVVLLIGAGLFIRSLWNARTLDLGVEADRVLVVEPVRAPLSAFAAGEARESERSRRRLFLRDSLPDLRAVPGASKVSVATGMPFGYRFSVPMRVPELPDIDLSKSASVSAVADDYFETVGTPLIEGRPFSAADRQGSAPVAIVSAHMARQIWQQRSPIGACIVIQPPDNPCATIVGVASDTHMERLRESAVMHVYQPSGQEVGYGGAVLLVRSDADPATIADAVKLRLVTIDPSITLVRTQTLQDRIDPQLRSWKVGATIFVFAGVLALCVAAAGLFSVLAYVVASRQQEIGVRLALGASAAHIGGVVIRASLLMAGAGILSGVTMAAAAAPVLEPLLFDVAPRDPAVYLVVVGAMGLVACVASAVPAVRAARIDPLAVLRD